jgi:hypothetical protein
MMTSPPRPGGARHVSGVEIGNEMDIYLHQKAGRAPHRNASYTEEEYEVRTDAVSAQKRGQLPPSLAAFPPECMSQLAPSGPT